MTHVFVGAFGFMVGIYTLPILIAPPAPASADIQAIAAQATFSTEFTRELKDSDSLHWGEGKVSLSDTHVTLMGKIAPGPDYKLYLSPEFVETEADFERLKSTMVVLGDVKTFDNFIVRVEPNISLTQYNTVIVWCESFGQFITSAKYR